MEMFFTMPHTADDLASACERLSKAAYLGFDTETTELEPRDGEVRLVQLSDGKETLVVDLRDFRNASKNYDRSALKPLLDLLSAQKPRKIAHNARFDAKWILHHLQTEVGGIYDTMIASQLIAAGDSDRRHSLADVASYFLQTTVDKTEQVSDWSADDLSQSQLEYAARDAQIMLALREKVDESLEGNDLVRCAQLEFEVIVPIAAMELNGVFLDESRWREQMKRAEADVKKIGGELQNLLSAGVSQVSLFGETMLNLESNAQVSDALRNLGIPIMDSTRASELLPLADKYPVIAKLLEYRHAAKSLSSFGENILDFVRKDTGRIHADFRQIGAPTGRFSCSKPNLQQIPQDDAFRRCFRAPDGKKLVIADYSQIELRILADFSQDANFIHAFKTGQDFHAITASQVFKVAVEDVTPDQRSFAKRLNFGVVYGIGASRFGQMTGLSLPEAEETLRRYFTTYRGLDSWLRERARLVLSERTSRTKSDRLIRHRFTDGDRASQGAAQRNAKNAPIQGTSADILKRALRLLHDGIRGTSAKLINIVHDEVIVEVDADEANDTRIVLEEAMRSAGEEFITNVPVKIDVHIADDWVK